MIIRVFQYCWGCCTLNLTISAVVAPLQHYVLLLGVMSLLIALSHVAAGHMSLVRPGPARNAIDRNLQLFKDNPWW